MICEAIGCTVVAQPRKFFCSRHWPMVPLELKVRLLQHYRKGQAVDGDVSDMYLDVLRECRVTVREMELSL